MYYDGMHDEKFFIVFLLILMYIYSYAKSERVATLSVLSGPEQRGAVNINAISPYYQQ
jgi:hypothetical protein